MTKVAVITAGLGVPSSSRMLADQLSDALNTELSLSGQNTTVDVLELRDYAVDIAQHLVTGFAPPALAAAIRNVTDADALIVVSPVFSGSYSGLFKSFFDVIDNTALEGMPVLMGATGGSARHALVLEHAMRPLFSYLRTRVVPTAVYAAPQDWGAADDDEPALEQRSRRAARELAAMLVGRPVNPSRPASDRMEPSAPFEDLLARIQAPTS
ncbi:FMN reductase [uncultured Arthrobacter sp.]|uniref:FMN reductase n=1 Tax=uncultured Arthrobacter sp. TaxID=114050 RepID=UPI0026199A0D|nr:FMN reductase [uncultured Arthrobacter sp.]